MILFNTIKFRINVHVIVRHPHEQAKINRCKAVKVNKAFNDKNHQITTSNNRWLQHRFEADSV